MNNQPNIFNYATSELSQDAFIAWLLSWSNKEYKTENKQLHQLGLDFLQSLLAKQNIVISEISNLEIKTQFYKIDVFVSFQMDNRHYGVIIEDKVHTIDHNNQLERYINKIKELNSKTVIVPVYFKTGYQHCYKDVIKNKYHPYTIKDFIEVLDNGKNIKNAVLSSYYQYILEKEKEYNLAEISYKEYKNQPIEKWDWWSCTGFFEDNENKFNAGWGSVGNNRQPLLALWCEGTPLNITDADTGEKLNLVLYLDIIHSTSNLNINFRIGNLNKHPQTNNRNKNNIYGQFSTVLTTNNIKHRKPNFKKSKNTLCLAQVSEIDMTLKHNDLIIILEQYKEILHHFAKNYNDA
jgi:hypothetical protein